MAEKYFCVQWQKFSQESLTLFSFDLKILFWGVLTPSWAPTVVWDYIINTPVLITAKKVSSY